MCIGKTGHQVEPVAIDYLGSFWDAKSCLRTNLIDPIAHNRNGLTRDCNPIFHIDNSDINNSVNARRHGYDHWRGRSSTTSNQTC